ncbi:multiubiquitin domain-containing protein [Streptomyces sp. WI04-05B]|uniref:multiubiquitin domain-containing protein n=1 Tax=Streptomyces TaxID=1883 RepID=UPI0029AB7252|nr:MULTISPECIES: multiubiquitin domain-containing protein [unclassified Streptomyces]MDX2546739.1 multiubiquitin domain-containing protein [Streptomyces sp. WI04-05B]MDX2589535.1 multiubiquitin domain-containing protein [Streptomyces sp. WI04-05A]
MSSTVEQADAQTPGKGHSVTITVNNKAVEIIGPRVTGLQIKEAAIAQGVQIELDFQLSQELPSGETRIIGDSDVVTVNKKSVFTAVAGDDNS